MLLLVAPVTTTSGLLSAFTSAMATLEICVIVMPPRLIDVPPPSTPLVLVSVVSPFPARCPITASSLPSALMSPSASRSGFRRDVDRSLSGKSALAVARKDLDLIGSAIRNHHVELVVAGDIAHRERGRIRCGGQVDDRGGQEGAVAFAQVDAQLGYDTRAAGHFIQVHHVHVAIAIEVCRRC